MKVLKSNITNIESEKKLLYRLTKGESTAVSKLDDEELDQKWPVDAYLQYEDTNRSGDAVTLLSILSNGRVLTAQSKPFQDAFMEIVDIMDDDPITLRIHHYVSRGGRKFCTCALDLD